MVYRVIDEVKYADDVSPKVICIVECTCINEQYERKNGQCIEKNNITKRNEAEVSFTLNFCQNILKYRRIFLIFKILTNNYYKIIM